MAKMTDPLADSAFDGSLPEGADDARWQMIELEIAREQLKVLSDSMLEANEKVEQLGSELRMLPWNCARSVRDARLALGAGRTALAEVQLQADAARGQLQRAADELAAAEAKLASATPERRARGLGLLMRRRRRHDGALLDLRMNHALAGEQLQAAMDRCNQAHLAVERQQQHLNDLLAQRRRQRSILIGEIEALERRLQREQLQYDDYARIVAEFESAAGTVREDALTPA